MTSHAISYFCCLHTEAIGEATVEKLLVSLYSFLFRGIERTFVLGGWTTAYASLCILSVLSKLIHVKIKCDPFLCGASSNID